MVVSKILKGSYLRNSNPFNSSTRSNTKNSHTSISGRERSALNSVMVLPLPGGPHKTSGLCSANHVFRRASWRTVSTVGTTTSGEATLWVSTSICGTLERHNTHSPCSVTCVIASAISFGWLLLRQYRVKVQNYSVLLMILPALLQSICSKTNSKITSTIEEFQSLLLKSLPALDWLFETKVFLFHVSKVFEFEKVCL